MAEITVIGKSGCHLCEVAGEVIAAVLEQESEQDQLHQIRQLSIADDPELYAKWWEKIPVVLIDGEFHTQWRVEPERLRAALNANA